MFNRFLVQTMLAALVFASGIGTASAYLDPGSGSVILQVILGGLAGLAVAGKLFWQQIISFFTFGRRDKKGSDE